LSRETDSKRDSPAPSRRNASKAQSHMLTRIFCLLLSISSFAELDKESSFYNVAIVDRRRDVFVVTNTFYKLQVCRDELLEETNYKLTLPFARHLFGCGKTVRVRN
jgi:hypothetical protein